MVTRYSQDDRRKQLEELLESFDNLCRHLKDTDLFPEMLNVYVSRKLDVASLLKTSFSQSELSKLSRNIPDIYNRHKDWLPPLEQSHGKLREPDWFVELEACLQPVLKNAQLLRELGFY